MEFLKKLWNNVYFRQVLYAIGGFFVLIFLLHIFLNIFTRHGQSSPVPDFRGVSMDSVQRIAKENKLRLIVVDSVFVASFPRGTVFEQNPKAGVHVKKNRKVFLTMNLNAPKKVPMPNVVNYSLRQAKAELTTKGFQVGTIRYSPDIATNIVLSQEHNGKRINENMMLPMGSKIDLVLGLNSSEETTSVPNVVGLSYNAARDLIIESSLNVGKLNFDKAPKNITDTLNSIIYKQEPAYYSGNYVSYGRSISLFLKPDKK